MPDLPSADDVARFAAGADTRATEPAAAPRSRTRATSGTSASAAPWKDFDKDAKPLSGINLRLNDYEHALLKYLADSDERSIQQTIKRLLVPAAEAAVEQARRQG